MLEKEFVPYDESYALKELGFDEHCFAAYYTDIDKNVKDKYDYRRKFSINYSEEDDYVINKFSEEFDYFISAPTYSQAFRWFREKRYYHIYLQSFPDKFWNFVIEDISEKGYIRSDGSKRNMPRLITNSDLYKNYDDVQIACLKKLIEIIKYK